MLQTYSEFPNVFLFFLSLKFLLLSANCTWGKNEQIYLIDSLINESLRTTTVPSHLPPPPVAALELIKLSELQETSPSTPLPPPLTLFVKLPNMFVKQLQKKVTARQSFFLALLVPGCSSCCINKMRQIKMAHGAPVCRQ